MGKIITLNDYSETSERICLRTGVNAMYRAKITKARTGKLKYDTGWFPNLITDIGLSYWILSQQNNYADNNSMFQFCVVGAGSTTPTYADISLASYVATAGGGGTGTYSFVNAAAPDPAYRERVFDYQFSTGAAAGNLTEIGVFAYDLTKDQLFSRALILDGAGNPTSITVLSDEILTVTYKIREYYDVGNYTFTFNLNGTPITGTYTNWYDNPFVNNFPYSWQGGNYTNGRGYCNAYSGAMVGALSGSPVGYLGQTGNAVPYSVINDIPNSGTIYADYKITFGVGNATGTINTLVCYASFSGVQFGNLSQPIIKGAGQQLQVQYRNVIGRYP